MSESLDENDTRPWQTADFVHAANSALGAHYTVEATELTAEVARSLQCGLLPNGGDEERV